MRKRRKKNRDGRKRCGWRENKIRKKRREGK